MNSFRGLTFDKKLELKQGTIQQLQNKLPYFISELNILQQTYNTKLCLRNTIEELEESTNEKLDIIQSQENETVDLMMEWDNHRHHEVSKFNEDSSELQTLKTKILELKKKIFRIEFLQKFFTKTNQSIKEFNEVDNQLQESMREIDRIINNFMNIAVNLF